MKRKRKLGFLAVSSARFVHFRRFRRFNLSGSSDPTMSVKIEVSGETIQDGTSKKTVYLGSCPMSCVVKQIQISDLVIGDIEVDGGSLNGGLSKTKSVEDVKKRLEEHVKFNHDNILQMFCYESTETVFRVAMENGGINLSEFLRENGWELLDEIKRPTTEVIEIIRGVAKAVESLHSRNLPCPHLKPSNVFVDKGKVKVDPLADCSQLDTHWIAPEEYREGNRAMYWKQADMFRLGHIIYLILTEEMLGDDILKSVGSNKHEKALDKALEKVRRIDDVPFLKKLLTREYTSRLTSLNLNDPFFWEYSKVEEFFLRASDILEKNPYVTSCLNNSLEDGEKIIWEWKEEVDADLFNDLRADAQKRIKRNSQFTEKERAQELKKLESPTDTKSTYVHFFRNCLAHKHAISMDTHNRLQKDYGDNYIVKHALEIEPELFVDLVNLLRNMRLVDHRISNFL